MVEALATCGPDQSFAKRIRLWNAGRCFQHAKTHRPQYAVNSGREHRIEIVDKESVRFSPVRMLLNCCTVHSAVGCSVIFQCRIRRVPMSSTRNT